MSFYANKPDTIQNLEFNDVAIQLSATRGLAMEGTLPASVEGGKTYEHTYTFDISKNELVQDKKKLRPVVVLIDTRTGEAVNADKISLNNEADGIHQVENGLSTFENGPVFDLCGQKVQPELSNSQNSLKKGVYIVNGKKIIIK